MLRFLAPLTSLLLLSASPAFAQADRDGTPDYRFTVAVGGDSSLHAGPADDAGVLAVIPAGAELRLATCVNGWCPVEVGGL